MCCAGQWCGFGDLSHKILRFDFLVAVVPRTERIILLFTTFEYHNGFPRNVAVVETQAGQKHGVTVAGFGIAKSS